MKKQADHTADEGLSGEALIRALQAQLDQIKSKERELSQSYAQLRLTKLAALNLMEDLRDEVEQRKRSEAVLQENERKLKALTILFRSISDNMQDMLWAKDLDKNYIFANKSFCENLLKAVDTDEPIGKSDLFFALRERERHSEHPEWHTFGEICADSDQIVLDSGRPQQFDEFGNIEGKFLLLDVRKSPLYDEKGTLIGTVGSAQDRTAEREISRQLADRERQLSTLVSNIPGMVYRTGEEFDSDLIFVSEGCFAVTGYSQEDYLVTRKIRFNDLILPEFQEALRERWYRVLSKGSMFEGEYPIRTADGTIRWVWERCRSEFNESGEILYVEGYIADVTERMMALAALRESEQRYQTFINSTNDFAFLKDDNFRYLFINQANAAFFNQRAEDIIGKDDFQLMQEPNARNCRETDTNALRGEGVSVTEETVDGRIYESRKFPVELGNGRIGLGGYIRDITDKKADEKMIHELNDDLERRVRERTAQLESANRELEAFTYSVSHDLRAPLRAIDGFARILFEDYEPLLDEEGKRVCSVIQENAIRMGQLIDDLLSLSRLNKGDLRYAVIDMEHMARTIYEESARDEEKQRISFAFRDLQPVWGDPSLMHQVLVNLISNAVKFTGYTNPSLITFSSEVNADRIVYCIQDNGAGFDMKYAGKLFGAFQRLHSIREFEGNGIGLAIVQRVIHRHGGAVWAKGEVGKGASFFFSLPLKPKKTGAPADEKSSKL